MERMLLKIETRNSVREIATAMRAAKICGLCKQAFATQPGLCDDCADVLERWEKGDEGLPSEEDRPVQPAF
jgi:hypothetical protein